MNDERAQAMFGTTAEAAFKIQDAFMDRAPRDQYMEIMSRLSDVQEVIAMGRDEQARKEINIVKFLVGKLHVDAVNEERALYEG